MDQKAVVILEVKKEERVFRFEMPIGSPYGEAYDAAYSMLNEILEMVKKSAELAENKPKDEAKVEEA